VRPNTWSATAIAALRPAVPLFRSTVKDTVPLPEPCAPADTTTHAALLVAVQSHPVGALRVKLPVPPSLPNDPDVGEIPYVHAVGVRPCWAMA